MPRKKKQSINLEKFGWIENLYSEGYKYIIMPKKNRTEFYATKANQKKDGSFRDTSKFDTYRLEKGESWIPGDDTKGLFIRL